MAQDFKSCAFLFAFMTLVFPNVVFIIITLVLFFIAFYYEYKEENEEMKNNPAAREKFKQEMEAQNEYFEKYGEWKWRKK